uniref:Uncharacterized protein n=1 Tax=Anguilla anguilla TaxID=7936 RepID=A0A0E9XBA8_ANGAN
MQPLSVILDFLNGSRHQYFSECFRFTYTMHLVPPCGAKRK